MIPLDIHPGQYLPQNCPEGIVRGLVRVGLAPSFHFNDVNFSPSRMPGPYISAMYSDFSREVGRSPTFLDQIFSDAFFDF